MAKIPLYTERETYSGRAPTVESIPGERIKAQNIPKVVDTSLESVSSVLTDIGMKMIQVEETEQYNRGMNELDKLSNQILQDANENWHNMDLEDHTKTFEERWDALESTVYGSIKSDNTKTLLTKNVNASKVKTGAKVRLLGRNRANDRMIASAEERKHILTNEAINASNLEYNDKMASLMAVNAGLVFNGVMTPQAAEKDNFIITDSVNLARVKKMVYDNPSAAFHQFTSDNPGETFSNLNPDRQREVLEYARTYWKRNIAEVAKVEEGIELRYQQNKNDKVNQHLHNIAEKGDVDINRLLKERDDKEIDNKTVDEILALAEAPETKNNPIVLNDLYHAVMTRDPRAKENIKNAYLKDKTINGTAFVSLNRAISSDSLNLALNQIRTAFDPTWEDNPLKRSMLKGGYLDTRQRFNESIGDMSDEQLMKYAKDLIDSKMLEIDTKVKGQTDTFVMGAGNATQTKIYVDREKNKATEKFENSNKDQAATKMYNDRINKLDEMLKQKGVVNPGDAPFIELQNKKERLLKTAKTPEDVRRVKKQISDEYEALSKQFNRYPKSHLLDDIYITGEDGEIIAY